ncbi:MAG: hypothetical protein HC917_28710 [Richelia sp. SM2_1_7]|nr:hypothetical protein [Richelia sp. SM2_1_7]
MHNFDNMKAGTIIATTEAKLGWTASKSQPIQYLGKSGKIVYGNRAVSERDGKLYVKSRSKVEVEVIEVGDGKYEVRL